MKLTIIVGTRPNFVKAAALFTEFHTRSTIEASLVHTGQHYDTNMSDNFFHDLGIPQPDVNLGVASKSAVRQIAEIMTGLEEVFEANPPDWVLVVGDVNSTLAGALAAQKCGIKVAHVEAGLRSYDREMPEEVNRVIVDQIADLLFVTEQSGIENLKGEGICDAKIHLTGNVMVDTLLRFSKRAQETSALADREVEPQKYGLVTLHRASNTDDQETLRQLLEAVVKMSDTLPMVFPMHPRTRNRLSSFGMDKLLDSAVNLKITEPVRYLDFVNLMSRAAVVVTDSGGIQEETTVLGVPCLTIRKNTERPSTIEHGTNQLVGTDPAKVLEAFRSVIDGSWEDTGDRPPLWDGKAACRIVDILLGYGASSCK